MTSAVTVTRLLQDWRSGDPAAMEQLAPLVYDDLRAIAARRLRSERAGHTLQATALVNEAYARLAEGDMSFQDRAHFFALAARMMRRILTDYARARNSKIPDLDDAIERLSQLDSRKGDVLVLHYFGGMTYDEIASALDVSAATVDRDLRLAKAWLAHELRND